MSYNIRYSVFFTLLILLTFGCGPSEKEKQQREQARQDSLAQVRQDSLEQVRQQRQDSLAKARADSQSMTAENTPSISLSENGQYSIQVESWRSQKKAQQRAKDWQNRGFDHAFVVQYGNKATGDIWYRVRLGRVDNRQKVQQLQQNLQDNYQAKSWIGMAK